MLPLMPQRRQRFGAMGASIDERLRDIATVATAFINLNKKKGFRKNFFISCGNSGNKTNNLYMGDRLNKKTHPLKPSTRCNNEVNEVKNATTKCLSWCQKMFKFNEANEAAM